LLISLTCQAGAQETDKNTQVGVLPVQVGDEMVIAADGPGRNCRGTPAVAFGKGSYLVAWREGWEGKNGGARIRAALAGPDGKLRDGRSFELAANEDKDAPQERPRVAFAGDTFLVVWHALRNGKDYDVLAARVSAAGKLLDAEPIRIAAGPHNQALPDVAADNEGFLVVWQGFEESDRAFHGYAARVTAAGTLGEPSEIGLAPCPRVAWDGAYFLVGCANRGFWKTGDVLRLDRDGKPPAGEKSLRVTVNVGLYSLSGVPGKGWLLVTHRNSPNAWGWGGPGAMRCYYVLSEGKMDPSMSKENDYPGYDKYEPNWVDYSTKDRSNWPYGLSASAWDGKQSVVVWQRYHCTGEKNSTLANSDIMLMRTDGWRRQSDVPVSVAASDAEETEPALASDGAGNLLCVYEKEVDEKTMICARVVLSSQGATGDAGSVTRE
jgi:hypothetical protein